MSEKPSGKAVFDPLPPEYNALSERIIGAAIEVHRILGPGLLEAVYDAAMEIEFKARGIRVERHKEMPVHYKGILVGSGAPDYLVEGLIIVELKAVSAIAPAHIAKLKHYLALLRWRLGLILNFHGATLTEGIHRHIA